MYESVIATGQVEELFAEEKHRGLVLLVQKYSPNYFEKGSEYIKKFIESTKVFTISVESVTGKARK